MTLPAWFEPEFRAASEQGWRGKWFRIIFRHALPDERRYDLWLLVVIGASVLVAVLDTVAVIHRQFGDFFYAIEWVFTILFAIEYVLRLSLVRRSWRYATSFYGMIDLAAVLPTFLSLVIPGADHLIVIRILRVLRVFRIFEMLEYSQEGSALVHALYNSRRKIAMFVLIVALVTVVFGALMYLIEGPEHGFTSIPRSMYWAIVTMATVGFGDIVPQTAFGQFLTSIIVLIGYGVLAVPTGIFGAEYFGERNRREKQATVAGARNCARCEQAEADASANYCHRCGERLPGRDQSDA